MNVRRGTGRRVERLPRKRTKKNVFPGNEIFEKYESEVVAAKFVFIIKKLEASASSLIFCQKDKNCS